jgi:adenine phosphoribosyltransferase
MQTQKIKSKIREIPDWPKKGVGFKDITPLLQDAVCFQKVIDELAKKFSNKKIDKIVGIDARGFLLASAVAYKLGAGVAIVRKKGKLPYQCLMQEYDLEYGTNCIEMHKDAILPGERVAIIDDVLATGGTAQACAKLVEQLKGKIVGIAFLMDLTFLKGKEKLKKYKIYSLIKY